MVLRSVVEQPGTFLDEETGHVYKIADYVAAPPPRCKVCDQISFQWSKVHYHVCLKCEPVTIQKCSECPSYTGWTVGEGRCDHGDTRRDTIGHKLPPDWCPLRKKEPE